MIAVLVAIIVDPGVTYGAGPHRFHPAVKLKTPTLAFCACTLVPAHAHIIAALAV